MNKAKSEQSGRMRFALILAGLLLYVFFLIMQMPAAWLVARLSADSELRLNQTSGSPWHGAVRQIIWRKGSDQIELGGLAWDWIPSELLHARLGLTFELGQTPAKLKGIFLLGSDGKHLKTVQGQLDATILGFVARPLSLMQPQGKLALNIADLHLGAKRIHGEAQVDWQNARSGSITAPLGDYRAELQAAADGRSGRISLHTLQGALSMNGDGDYVPGKGITGKLLLAPPQDERRKLYTPVLNLFGRPDAGGVWALNFTPQ